STSAESAGSDRTGMRRPWRRALRAAVARPAAVFGPVLRRELARLARSLRGLIMYTLLPMPIWQDVYKFGLDRIIACPSQSPANARSVPLEFAQSSIAARLSIHHHPINSFKPVDVGREGPRYGNVHSEPLRGK